MTTKDATVGEQTKPENSPPQPGGELETSTGVGTDEGQNTDIDPSDQPPAPVDPYAGTHMEGKTPEEVRAYMSLLEGTVREQSMALTQAQNAPPPPPEPEEDVDFFANPRQVIRQELETMVKPLNDQLSEFQLQGKVNAAWSQARGGISDFDKYEPYIKQILEGQNIRPDQVNVELLRSLYYTAVGYVARHGGSPPSESNMGHPQTPPVRQAPQAGVPQHRPSSTPLPTPTDKVEAKLRTLTENEARLAREWGMSPAEYIAYQEAEAEDVLTTDFGGNNA